MSVEQIVSANHYIGRSTDNKPTDAPFGSDFFELDTGQRYIWDHDNLVWVENIAMVNALLKGLGAGQR